MGTKSAKPFIDLGSKVNAYKKEKFVGGFISIINADFTEISHRRV